MLQLHKISENASTNGRKLKDGVETSLLPITPVYTYSPTFGCVQSASVATDLPQVGLPKEKQLDSVSNSPIVFSETLKLLYGSDTCRDSSRSEADTQVGSKASRKQETKGLELEWVEQYEPGVYITFTILPSGQKGLKRVRFR